MQNLPNILFVINPIAGGGKKKAWEEQIRAFFTASPEHIWFFTQTGNHDEKAIRHQIAVLQPGIVVAVGGDGTVKMVAELVKGTSTKMGIIPAGSANGLARELGISTALNEAIQVILDGHCSCLDAILINETEHCFHLSDVGMNALLVKYFEASSHRGMWGYARVLFKMLRNIKRMRVSIQTDTEHIRRRAYMVVLANAEKYGTGAVINPNGRVDDGRFEVVVIRRLNLLEILKALTARKAFRPHHIEVLQTTRVSLQFSKEQPFQVDGEYLGKKAKIQAQILPGVVQVLRPLTANGKA